MPKGMELSIDVRSLEPVKEAISILGYMLNDDRVPEDVRIVYRDMVDAIDWEPEGSNSNDCSCTVNLNCKSAQPYEPKDRYVIGASSLEVAKRIAQAHGLHQRRQWVYAYAGLPRRLRDGLWVASKDKLLGDFSPQERAQLTAHLKKE